MGASGPRYAARKQWCRVRGSPGCVRRRSPGEAGGRSAAPRPAGPLARCFPWKHLDPPVDSAPPWRAERTSQFRSLAGSGGHATSTGTRHARASVFARQYAIGPSADVAPEPSTRVSLPNARSANLPGRSVDTRSTFSDSRTPTSVTARRTYLPLAAWKTLRTAQNAASLTGQAPSLDRGEKHATAREQRGNARVAPMETKTDGNRFREVGPLPVAGIPLHRLRGAASVLSTRSGNAMNCIHISTLRLRRSAPRHTPPTRSSKFRPTRVDHE